MIHSVTGTIKEDCGKILMHEHIRCASNDMLHTFKDEWLSDEKLVEYSVEILKNLKQKYGVGLVVDATPIDLGRNVRILREISEKSGVKIVASTGLYYYPSMLTANRGEDEIASWFLTEAQKGIENTDIKPGVLKCALDDLGITRDNAKRMAALAKAQRQTGYALYVHTLHQEKTVFRALEILKENGVNFEKTVIGHAGLRADFDYLKSIIDTGCYICIDQCHCVPNEVEKIAKTLVLLCENGFSERILLSNDACIYSDFGSNGRVWLEKKDIQKTWGYIFEYIYPKFLSFGGSEEAWNKIMCKNPLVLLSKEELYE